MTAVAMKCIKAEKHPNADALRVYEFVNDGEPIQIIANLENIYEVDDVVAIALTGSVLKDGTKIRPTKLRDLPSYGMALGKTEAAVGTDLSEQFCQKDLVAAGTSHIPWPDIESLYNIRRYLVQQNMTRVIRYKAKVKLDGTNAGIQIKPDGSYFAQSRSRLLTENHDNMDFGKWVKNNEGLWTLIRENADKAGLKGKAITVFGEYCGQGIQKRTAISQIDRRILAVFAIQIGELDAEFECNPEIIQSICPQTELVYTLPWYGLPVDLDYTDPERLTAGAEIINKMVEAVELTDPWVKETFGVEGIGEGVVMYPIIDGKERIPRVTYTDLVFKAKGEKHQVVKAKKPAQINPEFVATINGFVDLMVTENRLEQIAGKVGDFNMKKTGEFLKEFNLDVQKESVAELEAADLEWKQVAKEVGTRARQWWTQKCKEL